MAHMAIAAGYSVNGVAKLHTEILKESGIKRFLSDDAREIQQQDKWNHTETFLNAWKPITCRLGNKETWNRHMGNRPFFNVRTEEICG